MEHAHLSVEDLAKLLSGSLEHEKVTTEVVPHLLERCPACRERYEEIRRLQEEVGHWSEEVAVFEGREAPELWQRLRGRPYDEQVRLMEEEEGLHSWGLCQLLLKKSIEAAFEDPTLAVRLANLAVRASVHLGEAYDPHWVMDLRARALAHLGNARRVLGELESADEAFREARAWLAASTTGNLRVRAEILGFESSLRRAQRRLEDALELIDRALALYRESEDATGIGKCILKKGKILEETGRFEEAIALLQGVEADLRQAPRLLAFARFNLLVCFARSGREEEAERLLPEVRRLFGDLVPPLNQIRLRWAEGLIDLGLRRPGPAESAFREVQREFLERGMGYDAALVSLDLALLYAQEGETAALKRLAWELMPVFTSREVHREATAALLVFQHACSEERVSTDLVRHLAAFLWREKRGRGPFVT